MKNLLTTSLSHAALLILLVCLGTYGNAQMKIGNHPTQIHKASILELESNRQGLLLTRIPDTSAMTALDPPDGMLIYSTKDNTIYIRSNYAWQKLITAAAISGNTWSINGNAGTDSASNFLGTTDAAGLRIGTGNIPTIIISRSGIVKLADSLSVGGNANFRQSIHIAGSLSAAGPVNISDSLRVEKTLYIGDSITLETVRKALPGDSEVLVISPGGIIRKLSIDSLRIKNDVLSSFHLKTDTVALSQGRHGPWIDSVSAKTDSTLIVNLPNAGTSVRGLVTSGTQAFGGAKSFADSIAIGLSGTPNSSLQINGNMSTSTRVINSGNSYDMSVADNANCRTIIVDATNLTGEFTVSLPEVGSFANGRVYTIRKVGNADDPQLDEDVKIVSAGDDSFEDGGRNYFIYNNFTTVTVQAEDGKWYILR